MRAWCLVSVGMRPACREESVDNTTSTILDSNSLLEPTQTSQSIDSINVHCTAPTDSFPTAPPKRQGRINLVLDPDQRI